MRLLHFDQSDRLMSTDFSGITVPPYAILSHRWGNAEVVFEDVGRNPYRKKAGYRKIAFCAKQAAQDGLQYFWIDTCCIDKWNYKNPAKCYVFLTDVSVATAAGIARGGWEASLRASEWFTRGWTLQEPVAPASVEFFSKEGLQLGNKRSLQQLIHEITGIPVEALRESLLDRFSMSERIGWAKARNTTEEEDQVYCLLGILGLSMPTSYGEGKEKAWARLYTEIETADNAPCIIPFIRNDRFAGRESQLAELEAKLFKEEQTTTIAVVGPPGTGKSQLALELAYRTRQKNKSCSIFWVDASDSDGVYQSYVSIAQKLNVAGWDEKNANIIQLVKLHLSSEIAGQWLAVFDNVDG
ncbi:hypothetical protein GRF29_77g1656920, partial [Pseudopithomyces chartarum]